MKNIYNPSEVTEAISRINKLNPSTQALWGKMDVAQMLAHCNVPYTYTYEIEKFKKPNFFKRFMLQVIVKPIVLGPKPYTKNGRTAPEFIISDKRDFAKEKEILIRNITKTQELGEKHFEGLENLSFGKMSAAEWNVLFGKHLDHHLSQFGV
jgi:hypothetical protein